MCGKEKKTYRSLPLLRDTEAWLQREARGEHRGRWAVRPQGAAVPLLA